MTRELFAHLETAAVPPWQDPTKVKAVTVEQVTDPDNGRPLWLLTVTGHDGQAIRARRFTSRATAFDNAQRLTRRLDLNRQLEML